MDKRLIAEYIESKSYTPQTAEALFDALDFDEKDIDSYYDALSDLEDEGVIVVGRKDRIFSAKKLGFVSGVFRSTSKGFGFLIQDGGDIHIAQNKTNGALNGDTVLARIEKGKGRSSRPEGVVIRVLSRRAQNIVGTFKDNKSYGVIIPDNEKLPEIFVSPRDFYGALDGQKVLCEITEYETPTTSLCGRVKEVLGFPNDFGVDILSVIKSYGFSTEFPKKVLDAAENCPPVCDEDLTGRTSFLDDIVITIDGSDTKDIDDAISISKNGDAYRLCVHIADVSNYVKFGSIIDKEAYIRGTSVYPVGRVIPMLPVKLSNGLCSLNEGEIRLTMSVVMDIDESGNVIKSSFHKSYIKSRAKMTYHDVWKILAENDSALCEKYKEIVPSLKLMYSLAKTLSAKTSERGALDFNIPEAKAVLDEKGTATDIVLYETTFANKLIEEFMVLANSCVAKFLSDSGVGAIYRVHETPNEQKLEIVKKFMYNIGYKNLSSVKKMMAAVKDTPQETAVYTMLLRSMAKAKYSSENAGHYGLSLENYCHFTSPIRRYPDLVCHRALKAVLDGNTKVISSLKSYVPEASEHCSEQEYAAAMTERDTLDVKKAEYMHQFIGEEFDGIISSVTDYGFFVQLPNTVEGLVRVELLRDDYYNYNESTLSLIGERTNRSFTIGDNVKVKLVSAEKSSGKIDFNLIEGGKKVYGGKSKKKSGRSKQNSSSRVFHRRKNRSRH